jgi:hypothetical protein
MNNESVSTRFVWPNETAEEIAARIITLSAEAARMPEHWVERRTALHAQLDELLDRLLEHRQSN